MGESALQATAAQLVESAAMQAEQQPAQEAAGGSRFIVGDVGRYVLVCLC